MVSHRLGVGIAALLALGALALPAGAAAEPPTTQDLIEALSGARPAGRTRTLAVLPAAGPSGEAAVARVALDVKFEFNSDRLTDDARNLLDRLGEAVASRSLAASRFDLVGHTDAVGAAAYNQRLSERRAEAVKRYLERHHGIAADRLTASGMGASQLLDPAQPDGAVNRRVEVVNLGP